MTIKLAILAGGALCASLLVPKFHTDARMKTKTFVMAESGLPVSLDPLEADYSNNLHASQMVHRSILEVDGDNVLKSSFLSSFAYDPVKHQIEFVLKPGEKFSDGSAVTVEDLEISIKRMLLRRPTFPVIRHIQGVEDWTRTHVPLSQPVAGIRTEGNILRIQLNHDVKNPLFRFALPLFGVVKKSCVDLEQNRLKKDCATSGYYTLKQTKDDTLEFAMNPAVNHTGLAIANAINIRYIPRSLEMKDLQQMEAGNFVVLAQEYSIGANSPSALDEIRFERLEQPNSRFSCFLLNPHHPAFKDEDCRRVFADAVRAKTVADSPLVQKESSIFSRILPGYMSQSELAASAPLPEKTVASCKAQLKGQTLRWMGSENNNSASFERALLAAAEELGIKIDTLPQTSPKERYEDFARGRIDIQLGGSGFWAFDPVGDVQMLFTRGLHKPLQFVAGDDHLQSLLNGLEFLDDPNPRMREINIYLYKNALFNVISHSKRVYFIKGNEVNRRIPIAITPPAPWQVFDVAGS